MIQLILRLYQNLLLHVQQITWPGGGMCLAEGLGALGDHGDVQKPLEVFSCDAASWGCGEAPGTLVCSAAACFLIGVVG